MGELIKRRCATCGAAGVVAAFVLAAVAASPCLAVDRDGSNRSHVTGDGGTRPVAQTVPEDSARLLAVSRDSLSHWLAARSARQVVIAVAPQASVVLPPGSVSLSARPLADLEPITPRMQVWIDVAVDHRFVRAVPVAFDVQAFGPAWVATRDVRVGETLAGAALAQKEVDIARQRAAPLADPPANARLRRPLLAGEALTAAHVETVPPVQRGEYVTVRSQTGAVGIEARAEALQDGRPGQLVWVRLASATGPVHARVVSEGIVEVQHE